MLRQVTVLRYADRHAELHTRQFAQARSVTVPDGDPSDVVAAALEVAGMDLGDRFSIIVDAPHEISS